MASTFNVQTPARSVERWLRKEWTWLLPILIALLVALGSSDSSSYFLHFDTATESHAALDVLNGCWGYSASKPLPMLIMVPVLALGNSNPAFELIPLTILSALALAALFRLVARLTGSTRWGMLAALWYLSLPTILYYSRIHIGYPLAFFILGIAAQEERWYGWSGVAFGLALTAHPNFAVPVSFWLFWSGLAYLLTYRSAADKTGLLSRIGDLLRLGGGMLIPILAVESIQFLYDGQVLGWSQGYIREALRLSESLHGGSWPPTHLLHIVGFSNGWLNLALLLIGLAYPFVRERRITLADAVFLSAWSVLGFYSLRVARGSTFLTPRMFAAAYPLLVTTTIITAARLASRLPSRMSAALRPLIAVMLLIGLPLALIEHTLDVAVASHTGYNAVDQAFSEAAREGVPVRYVGNWNAGRFFGMRHQVEVGLNDTDPASIVMDRRAVLIFDGLDPVTLADGAVLDPALYEISTVPHMAAYRPRAIENYALSPAFIHELEQGAYGRKAGVPTTYVEVWWPRNPTSVPVYDYGEVAGDPNHYYSGSGCASPRPFGYGTQNFYHLLLAKARRVAELVRHGQIRQALDQLLKWITG
jgi:hypothetical protein